jgi:hypothetical protein
VIDVAPQQRTARWLEQGNRIFVSWNQLERWFRDIDALRRVA